MRRVTRSQAGHGADTNTPLSDSPVPTRRGRCQVRSTAAPLIPDTVPADDSPHPVPDPADDLSHLVVPISDLTTSPQMLIEDLPLPPTGLDTDLPVPSANPPLTPTSMLDAVQPETIPAPDLNLEPFVLTSSALEVPSHTEPEPSAPALVRKALKHQGPDVIVYLYVNVQLPAREV